MSGIQHDATNDYSDVGHGINIDEKPYVKVKSFARNYASQYAIYDNKHSFVIPKRKFTEPRVGESALQTSQFISKEVEMEKFKDLYGPEFKKMLYDAWTNDYVIQESFIIRAWAAFSPQLEVKLMPMTDREYQSDAELTTALDDTGHNEKERKDIIDYVEQVLRFTRLRKFQQDVAQQAMTGGRAALFIETFEGENNKYDVPKGTPAVIKPLHWSYLDQVRVNTDDWGFNSVRYRDFEQPLISSKQIFIPASKLIYVTRNDHLITPNNLFYGVSDIHPILKLSQMLRRIEEVDLQEIVTSYWAQPGIFKFNNMNQDEIDTFMDSLGPGLLRGFNSKVDYQGVPLKHDGWFLDQLMRTLIEHMLMKLRVPQFLFSFGGKNTSRSEVEVQMNVFRDVVLDADRQWMERHISDQFYDHLIGLKTGEMDPRKHKLRVIQVYKPLNFEDILAKANSIELLTRRAVIDRFEARAFVGLPPHNKNLDKYYDEVGQLKDLPPIEKIRMKHQEEQAEKRMESFGGGKQTTFQEFGQKGFTKTAPQRKNAAPLSQQGAGRGNKT